MKITQVISFISVALVMSSQCVFALDQSCPPGFTYSDATSVQSNTGQGNALQIIKVAMPMNRDFTYHQGKAAGSLTGHDSGGAWATTPWAGQHNIAGIWLEVGGNYYYALGITVDGQSGFPKAVADIDDSTGQVTAQYVQIGAYCGPGGNGEGCTATAKVCYKPK